MISYLTKKFWIRDDCDDNLEQRNESYHENT